MGIQKHGDPLVQVRTCHKHHSDIIVENIRPWVEFVNKRKNVFSMKLRNLNESGWNQVSPPFFVVEPVPNFMCELTVEDFRLTFEANRLDESTLRVQDTPAFRLIQLHYEQCGVNKGWTSERITRLCHSLNMTPGELGALICVSPGEMEKLARNGSPFSGGAIQGPVALWLKYLEDYGRYIRLGIRPPRTFPDILEERLKEVA